jgi:hypothetical protein
MIRVAACRTESAPDLTVIRRQAEVFTEPSKRSSSARLWTSRFCETADSARKTSVLRFYEELGFEAGVKTGLVARP